MSSLERKRRYILVFLAATLSSTVVLKVGEIQYLELIFAADFLVLVGIFATNGWHAKIYRPFAELGKSYAIFLVLAFLLSLFALQQDFTTYGTSFFKRPLLVTVARMAELFLDVFYMLYFASLFREDERLCRFGARTYLWTGVIGCMYSIVTFPLNLLFELQLGTYSNIHRFRGFNNEGGPFGVYLLSVVLLAVVIRHRGWLSRKEFAFAMAILVVGFIGSQSKAAFVAVALLGMLALTWTTHGARRWLLMAAMFAGLFIAASLLNFQGAIDAYIRGSEEYQKASNLHSEDANYVMGRISGAILGPRMIAARPLLGIGWGNYPMVRDDREYRQGTAFSTGATDAPGLGIIDYVVELGIPLWIYLTWVQFKPVLMLRRKGADPWLASLAMVLPLSIAVGSHLNLTHLWVVLAVALGLGYQARGDNQFPAQISAT